MQEDKLEYGAIVYKGIFAKVKYVNSLNLYVLVDSVWQYLHIGSLPFVTWESNKNCFDWANPTEESIYGFLKKSY